MNRYIYFCLFIGWCFTFASPARAEEEVPRTIIALYNGGNIQESYIHTVAEMPLNHLGLVVEYHDLHEPLPDIAGRKDVRGVLTWFLAPLPMEPKTYFNWAIDALTAGKKFVILGAPGLFGDKHRYTDPVLQAKFLALLGIKITDQWIDRPFDVEYLYKSPQLFLTQKPYEWLRPPYAVAHSFDETNSVHLKAANKNKSTQDSDLIVTGPHGGYAADGYIFRTDTANGEEVAQWLVNPFEFFRLAFDTDDLPKPDTTTVAGRRMYYSSIDGDGWNSVTQIEEYRGKGVLCSQVIMDKAIKPFPDMPVLMAVIAADIDPDWAAVKDSRAIAQEFLALPQVEAGTHTYSHPFDWQFFEKGDWRQEIPFLPLYKTRTWTPAPADMEKAPKSRARLSQGFMVPRAYAREPFNIHKEIEGSVSEISALLPPGKKVEVLAWPGSCTPWEDVVRMVREAHLRNINGGDSRFDAEYPSYASEEPIGRRVGKERQIYNPTSNEDIYTNQWSENFNAFEYLKATLKNSETPIRLKPISIYYHIYSGEKEASLKALIDNISYARSQEIAPVTVGHYSDIADGFYTVAIDKIGPDKWQIDNRGALQTIRFDHATLKSVDFEHSSGVVGQRYLQGSLYVYLDADVNRPIIALADNELFDQLPPASVPYLISSRWLVSGLHTHKNGIDFAAEGFGSGEMKWRVPAAGTFHVMMDKQTQDIESSDGILSFKIPPHGQHPVRVSIRRS